MPEGRDGVSRLTELNEGQSGRVVGFDPPGGVADRLEAMGLREGKRITKISGLPFRGPVVVQAGGTRVALGHRMAARILVEPVE